MKDLGRQTKIEDQGSHKEKFLGRSFSILDRFSSAHFSGSLFPSNLPPRTWVNYAYIVDLFPNSKPSMSDHFPPQPVDLKGRQHDDFHTSHLAEIYLGHTTG